MFHRHLAVSIEMYMDKHEKEFAKELKKVLENEICQNQSLDNPKDRKRVHKEIMKLILGNNFIIIKTFPHPNIKEKYQKRKPQNNINNCPRCIEDWTDDEGKEQKGTVEKSVCKRCKVCKNCEHLLNCPKAKD